MILAIIGEIGTAGGTGRVIEYAGDAIRALSMEGRMTVCNMSIEGGARAGMIAPDEKTYAYIKGRPRAPKGEAWDMALALLGDARYRRGRAFRPRSQARRRESCRRSSPGVPRPRTSSRSQASCPIPTTSPTRASASRSGGRSNIWASRPARKITDITLDVIFIGSCTNGRIEDLRAAAKIVEGRKVNEGVTAMVVPGSGLVKEQAEAEGLDRIFKAAGFEWREPGCSMCLAMNADKLKPGERCASTSNRNFEGRQGYQGPHAPRLAANGRGGGDRRPLRRHPRLALAYQIATALTIRSGRQ